MPTVTILPAALMPILEITNRAFENLDKAERWADGDPGRVAEAYGGRSYVYMHLKNYDKAIKDANHSPAAEQDSQESK